MGMLAGKRRSTCPLVCQRECCAAALYVTVHAEDQQGPYKQFVYKV